MSQLPLEFTELGHQLAPWRHARRWVVALSGGIDSSALLHLLTCWRDAHDDCPPLTAIHVNHGLRPEADDWQVHCERLCALLRVPLRSRSVSVRPGARGIEAAAREARYRVFEEELERGDVLLLAHQLDDQVETFFLRLLRGAGVRGLAAMPASRPLGRGTLTRPLLGVARSRLEEYASRCGLQCIEDPSNSDTSLDRNFLRREVLPLVAARWPGYRRTVARASQHLAGAARTLREELPVPATLYSAMGDPGIATAELLDVSPEAAAEKLRGWLHSGGLPAPDGALLWEFLRQLREAGPLGEPRLQCSAYLLGRYGGGIYLLPDPEQAARRDTRPLAPGEACDLPGIGRVGLERTVSAGLCLDRGESVTLEWRRGGERCRLPGRAGERRLKKLLQEAEVPPWWRDRIPLVYLDGELLAVGDLWLCDSRRYREGAGGGESLWRVAWERELGPAFD